MLTCVVVVGQYIVSILKNHIEIESILKICRYFWNVVARVKYQ